MKPLVYTGAAVQTSYAAGHCTAGARTYASFEPPRVVFRSHLRPMEFLHGRADVDQSEAYWHAARQASQLKPCIY